MKSVTIWSKGSRMAGDLHAPANQQPGVKYPAVVCCHGWTAPLKGQVAATGLPQRLAGLGYFVLAFDYRGWGESEGMLAPVGPIPTGADEATLKVRIVREVFDPLDWAIDIDHAIDFIQGEPGVDPERIGLWGSSLGGGLVLWVAANDARVRCVVSQVGAHDYRGNDGLGAAMFPAWSRADMQARALEQARAPRYPLPMAQKINDAMGGLLPGPVDADVRRFAPLEWADRLRVPVLILDAENEPLYDRRRHAEEAFRRMTTADAGPVEYRVVPGTTHGAELYADMGGPGGARQLVDLAAGWFSQHL